VNLRAASPLTTTRRSPGISRAISGLVSTLAASYDRRPGLATLTAGFFITAVAAILELVNVGNYWLLFEDVSCAVAPTVAAIAIAMAAVRGPLKHRRLRRTLALSMGLTAIGQLIADVPDVLHRSLGALGAVSDISYVLGASLGVITLMVALYRQLEGESRRTVVLDGLLIMAATMTFVLANWLHQSLLSGGQVASLFVDPTANLVVPLASAFFFASSAAVVVAALSLRVEPSRRGVWAVTAGIVLLALAWEGWIGRFLAGRPDGIEAMDFIFPAGSMAVAYGAVTWSLARGGGKRYESVARATSDWLPIAAIVGCAVLDVMPRTRPLEVDPIAVGTCVVVLLAVVRLRVLQGRERLASERLTTEMSERAATTVSLARLEAAPTIEETAQRVCAEALHIDGIDTVVLYGFSPSGVVPMAQGGSICHPVTVGETLPERYGRELKEHAEFGLWLDMWTGRTPRDDFDTETIASGLRAEALAPIFWNDAPIGLVSMGATTEAHARRLSDRLATLTEFSVMSAAVLGPMLADRWQRDTLRAEVEHVISTRGFTPVFQPIVHLVTRKFVGYEALTRFDDGTRPDLRFIAADKVGMMVGLETACLNAQIEQARRLPAGSFVSLNVSPALAMCLMPLLDVVDGADRPVVLEITEHAEIEDYSKLMAALDQVRSHAMLAVDDAGAGYAGLHHILELQPQYVKLDISLVRNVDTDPARQAMVTGMTHFAEGVGCALIAEGIETENELTALKLLNVEYGQGFYLAKPAPIEFWAEAAPKRQARPAPDRIGRAAPKARRPRKAA
jgi:EAL domain-containing protein (putative c-di-GMP-specific phosphodiesterase class I)